MKILITTIFAFFLPVLVFAQNNRNTDLPEMVVTETRLGDNPTFQEFVARLIVAASNYALVLISGMCVIVFLYGVMRYIYKGQESDTARSDGRKLMFWGLFGLFVMASVWALVAILSNTIGHSNRTIPQFRSSMNTEHIETERA